MGRVNISPLAILAGSKGPPQHHRGTLCEPPPPKGNFLMPFNWPAKFWDVQQSLKEGETAYARLASLEEKFSGRRASPVPGTLGASHGLAWTKCALRRARDSGWSWQHQALPRFPSAPGESSNKSCLSYFITLLARADSGRSEPGPDLASPRSSLCKSRATKSLRGPG